MTTNVQKFFDQIKSQIGKDSDLPNFFAYYLTILQGSEAATVSSIRKCYEECDLHPPSWLGSHLSNGLRSKPRRFIRTKNGYRLENRLRQSLSEKISSNAPSANAASDEHNSLSGMQYYGIAGSSKDCFDAVVRLIQYGDQIRHAKIMTAKNQHALLLSVNSGDPVVIRNGFSTGYAGEGPRTFSRVLQLLQAHGAEISEIDVTDSFLTRLDEGTPSYSDEAHFKSAKTVNGRWQTYIDDRDYERARSGTLWHDLRCSVPFAIVDNRIFDLALSFWEAPDDRILKGYRRLEDLIRQRTGLSEHGSKLFSQAFTGKEQKLTWNINDDGEKIGRANLFTASFMAHRNPRAHRELKAGRESQLSEFLLLNHLYKLEKEAVLV